MMKSYMRSHLRDSLKTLLYLVVFSVAVTLIFSGSDQCSKIRYYSDIGGEWTTNFYYSSELGIPVWILAISCFALPVLEFSFFKKRRNLDCAYALPISRREMGIVHYVTGLLLLVIPYSCSYLVNFLLMLRYPGAFDYRLLFEHYILCMLLGICIYSVYVFVFNEANSTGDGVWFIILWTFVFFLISGSLFEFPYYNPSEMGISFMTLNDFTVSYMDIIDRDRVALTADIWENTNEMIYISLWLVLGILSMIGHYLTFGKRPAQHTEEVSNSWFGYRVMIPIYAVCGMVLWQDIGMWVIVEVIAFVGYMIYRKGLHLKKSDWISLAVFPVIADIMTTVTALLYWN